MDAISAVKSMSETSGVGPSEISRRLGRSRAFVSVALSRDVDLHTSTLVHIARVCGYRVQLVGHGETLDITDLSEDDRDISADG
mgnify:CR=1 FL=1